MEKINLFIEEANKLIGKISSAGQPGVCKFKQGDIKGCEAKDYDDSNWKSVMGKGAPINGISTDSFAAEKQEEKLDLCDWSMVDGEAAMRKKIKLPKAIHGISTEGTKLYITLTMLAPLDIYIDGKKAASYKYWGDSRQCEIVITESYKADDEHVVVFKTPKNDGDAHLGVYFNCGVLEEQILKLSSAVEQLSFLLKLSNYYPKETKSVMAGLKLSTSPLKKCDFTAIDKTLEQIDEKLAPIDSLAKQFKVHLIAHSHLDMNWLWDYADTIDICTRDFKTICDIMDENPDLRFSQSQSCVYDIVEKHDPATFKRVLKKIKEGSWEVTSATWSEHDLNTSASETFAQQILHAGEYTKNVLKAPISRVCWEPDTFGHPATVANVLTKAGVKYYYHFRCGTGHTLNWLEGTDGSRVLDYCFGPYNNALRPANLMPAVYDMLKKYGLKSCMFVFGVGDHGGGPSRRDIEIKRYLDKKPGLPNLVFSKVCDFFDEILTQKTDFPIHKGELNCIFEGCYTSKSRIKKLLRDGDARLSDAQSVLAHARLEGKNVTADAKSLTQEWQNVCFNGFHDISCGCNIRPADEHDYKIGEEAIKGGQAVIKKYVGGNANDLCITVFNQLGFARTDIVCTKAPKGIKKEGFVSSFSDELLPYQVFEGNIYFVATHLLPLSKIVYQIDNFDDDDEYVFEEIDAPMPVKIAKGVDDGSVYEISSERYLLEISARTGTIVRIFDYYLDRDVTERLKGIAEVPGAFKAQKSSNVLKMVQEEPHIMSAWVMGNQYKEEYLIATPKIEVVANGNVFTKVKITRKYNSSVFTQYITLYNELERIDFEVDLDFKELGHYTTGVPMLKVGFTFDVASPKFLYEIPCGSIEREAQNTELPAFRYVAMYNEETTVALLNNCKHGFYPSGKSLFMTLARNSYSPDACPDRLPINAKYAITNYEGKADKATITKDAAAFNQPLIAYVGGEEIAMEGLFNLNDKVVITAVKPSINNKGIVIRLQECSGKPQQTGVGIVEKAKNVYETTIGEEIIKALNYDEYTGLAEVNFVGNELKTLYFELERN